MNKQYPVEEYGQHVLGSAHERMKLSMPDTAEQQVELPPDGKQRTQAKTKTEKQKIVVTGKVLQRRVMQSQNMTSPRKAKANVIDQVLLRSDHGYKTKTVNMERAQ